MLAKKAVGISSGTDFCASQSKVFGAGLRSVVGISLISLFLVLFLSSASALTVSGNNTATMCQCETSKQVFSVCSATADNVVVAVSGLAAKWVSIAPQSFSLAANECKNVYAFITPECYATSSTYPVTFTFSASDQKTIPFSIQVNQCHTMRFNVSPLSAASNPCADNVFNFQITNTGKFVDEFVLTQTGLNPSWVSLPSDKFVLAQNETKAGQLKVSSSCDALPQIYSFSLTASNTRTNALQTVSLAQTINSFVPFTNNVPSAVRTCSEVDKNFSFFLKNVSTSDDELDLSLSAPAFVSLDRTKLVLKAGQQENVVLLVGKASPQNVTATLTVHSKNFNKDYNGFIALSVDDCYALKIQRVSAQTSYCLGRSQQVFAVRNKGTQPVTATIVAVGVPSDQKQVTLQPGVTENVSLGFNSTAAGDSNVIVSATSPYASDMVSFAIRTENCYGASLNVAPIKVCAGTNVSAAATVKNEGTRAQIFTLNSSAPWISVSPQGFSLVAGAEKEVALSLAVPQAISGSQTLELVSDSNTSLKRTLSISMLSQAECYDFNFEKTSKAIDVNCCSGAVTELKVTNSGLFAQNISLKKISPAWISFSEDSIALAAGSSKIVYVYFSPPAGTNGLAEGKINLSNGSGVTKDVTFGLNVIGGNCGVALGVDLNVTNNISGTQVFTRKDVTVEFLVTNDSNIGFNVQDINVEGFSSKVDFNKGVYLDPKQSTTAKLTITFDENRPQKDMNVKVNVTTSLGVFQKEQLISFSDANAVQQPLSVTGLFGDYTAPIIGALLIIIIIVILVGLAKVVSAGAKAK